MTREWVVYAGIMSVVFLFLFNDWNPVGAVAGVLVSGTMYLGLGWVLAKFGYQRKTMKELRTSQGSAGATGKTSKKDDKDSDGPRHRVVVQSSRTTGGGNRPPSKTNSRR